MTKITKIIKSRLTGFDFNYSILLDEKKMRKKIIINNFDIRAKYQKNAILIFNNILYKIMHQKKVSNDKINDKHDLSENLSNQVCSFLENFTNNMNIKCVGMPFDVSINDVLFAGVFDFIIKENNIAHIGLFDFNKQADLKYYKSNYIYSFYKEGFEREFEWLNIISIYNVPFGKFFNFKISDKTHYRNLKRFIKVVEK